MNTYLSQPKHYLFQPTPWRHLLKDLRIEAGLTQKQLAAKSSIPQRTIAEYENTGSTREMSIFKVEKLLDTLGCEFALFWKKGDWQTSLPDEKPRHTEPGVDSTTIHGTDL